MREKLRIEEGRNRNPSASSIDSQLVLIWVDKSYQGERFKTAVEHLSSATVEVMTWQGKGFQRQRECAVRRTAPIGAKSLKRTLARMRRKRDD